MKRKNLPFSIYHLAFARDAAGFTMIELLMVMAIMGVLAGLFIVTFPASQGRARDTQRKSDLKQYQTALEVYANKNSGFYPVLSSNTRASDNAGNPSLCNSLGLNIGAGTDCPADPKDNTASCSSQTCRYWYRSNAAGATEYVLWGAQERPASASLRYWVICSNGKSGESANAPSSSSCPI